MDKVITEPVYEEEFLGRKYKRRGCPNSGQLCMCTGVCNDKIYIDTLSEIGNNKHTTNTAKEDRECSQ